MFECSCPVPIATRQAPKLSVGGMQSITGRSMHSIGASSFLLLFILPSRSAGFSLATNGCRNGIRMHSQARGTYGLRRTFTQRPHQLKGASVLEMQQPREDRPFEAFAYGGEDKNPFVIDPAGYVGAMAVQSLPLLGLNDVYSHWVFFMGLATTSVCLGSRALPLVPPEAAPLSMRQALLAPFFGAATLGTLYYFITVLHIDPSTVYKIGTTVFPGFASSLLSRDALGALLPDLNAKTAEQGASALAFALGLTYLATGKTY